MNISSKSGTTNYRHTKEKRMGMLGTGSYLLFVIFQLLHHHCMAVAGDILVAPETQRVAINSGMAEFYCKTIGHNARWLVDRRTYDPENRTEDGLSFMELITPDPDGFDDNIYDIYMQIPSSLDRNSTEIRCLSARDQPVVSELVKLIIMGGPATPEPFLNTISTSLLTLEWNKPFSWSEYPVEHYTLTSNHSLYFPSELRINNATMSQGSMQIEKKDGLEECEVIEFTMKANNGLADSPAGTTTGGFPIALDESMASISEHITFSSDLLPIISLDIQLPRVCWFQEIGYTVELKRMDDNGMLVAKTELQTVKYWEQQSVTIRFEDDLSSGATYTATAFFQTIAGTDISDMEITTTLHTTMSTSTPATGALQPSTSPLTKEMLIIIGIVGGVLVLVLVMFIFVTAMACINMRRRPRRISSTRSNIQNRPLPMVTNPIYEGSPVYETVDQHLKCLTMERPHTPTTPTTPTSTDHLFIESPYAITTIDPSYTTQISQPFPEPENYTIMISAGHKSVSRSESDDVRYVQEPGSMNIANTEW